jgi:hypothetical protein
MLFKEYTMKQQDTYAEPKTYTYPGIVAKVYSPILTEEERQRRMAKIAKSAERLLTHERK